MNKYIRIILTLAAVLTLNGWLASADTFLLRTRVPFEFTVGNTTLPPGTYSFSRVDGSDAVFQIRGATHAVYFFSHAAKSREQTDPAKLIFNRYGDQYFLREVWFAGSRGYPLRESKNEREIATAGGDRRIAARVVFTAGVDR